MMNLRFILTLLIFTNLLTAQKYLNLDFEQSTPDGKAKVWYHGRNGYTVTTDNDIKYSGTQSLKIMQTGEGTFGVCTDSFPVDDARGKIVEFTGYIKTENVNDGYAGLWFRVDGENRRCLGFDNMSDRGATGTSDWKKFKIEMLVNSNVININFGALLVGEGTAWFDKLQINLDGKIYNQTEPKLFIPDEEQIAWLQNKLKKFDTAEPKTDSGDLHELKKVIGDAKIISLGEGTHGTSEFFKMKHRILKLLAESNSHIVFAIEANMPEARLVNNYVLNGEGDPRQALDGLYFWTWNTQEVLDMIEWMREFNASGKGKIEFRGFDMQTPRLAMNNITEFIKANDIDYVDELKKSFNLLTDLHKKIWLQKDNAQKELAQSWLYEAKTIFEYLLKNKSKFLVSNSSEKVEQILQDANILVQGAEALIPGKRSRDESMAENVDWLISHSPEDSKFVLWAHNAHVAKKEKQMGKVLFEKFHEQMIVFGFAFHKGTYTAIGEDRLAIYNTSDSAPGSFEWVFHKTGIERFIVDLRNIEKGPNSNWLKDTLEFRSIGAMAMDYAFYPEQISNNFDAVIFFDQTTPSKCFRITEKK